MRAFIGISTLWRLIVGNYWLHKVVLLIWSLIMRSNDIFYFWLFIFPWKSKVHSWRWLRAEWLKLILVVWWSGLMKWLVINTEFTFNHINLISHATQQILIFTNQLLSFLCLLRWLIFISTHIILVFNIDTLECSSTNAWKIISGLILWKSIFK